MELRTFRWFVANKKWLAGRWIALSLAAWAAAVMGPGAIAHELAVDVEGAWSRPAIAQGNGAVYFSLTNRESEPVTLVGASSTVARFTEIHETYVIESQGEADHGDEHTHEHAAPGDAPNAHGHSHAGHDEASPAVSVQPGPTLGMRKIDEITIAPGETVHFAPGGYHVMLIQLEKTLVWGERFDVMLHFADGHTLTFAVEVGAGGA